MLYQVTAAAVVVVPWCDDLEELLDFFNEELLPACWSCWTCSLFFNTAYTLSTWLSFSRRGMRSSNSRSSISSNQEEQGTWKMKIINLLSHLEFICPSWIAFGRIHLPYLRIQKSFTDDSSVYFWTIFGHF